MSLFHEQTIQCPACGESLKFSVNDSVNADRRPDYRDAIIDGSFQRETCPGCDGPLRMAPEMTYLDLGRNQWILVRPAENLDEWARFEEAARVLFDAAFGSAADRTAREIGSRLSVRVTFGWPALAEKLLCKQHGLDDVALEELKLALFRGLQGGPLSDDVELRLLTVRGETLVFGYVNAATEEVLETLEASRDLYDDVVADPEAWEPIRKELTAGPYVDFNRLLVASAPETP